MEPLRAKAPNLAVVLFACVPLVAIVINIIAAAGGGVRTGAQFFTAFYALGCALALMPLAARVKHGPEIALGITTVLFMLGGLLGRIAAGMVEVHAYDDASFVAHRALRQASRGVLVFAAAGLAAAFLRYDVYQAELDRSTFHQRVRGGLRLLLRDDKTAPHRAIGGMALAVITLVIVFLPLARQETGAVPTPIRGLVFGAIGLLASSLTLREEPDGDPILMAQTDAPRARPSASSSGPLLGASRKPSASRSAGRVYDESGSADRRSPPAPGRVTESERGTPAPTHTGPRQPAPLGAPHDTPEPFSPRELVERIRAQEAQRAPSSEPPPRRPGASVSERTVMPGALATGARRPSPAPPRARPNTPTNTSLPDDVEPARPPKPPAG